MTANDGLTTVGVPAAADPALGTALADLQRHGWSVLTGLRQPGRGQACIDAVLVGPGGVIVLEATTPRRRQSPLAAIATTVVAVVPAEARRHVQTVICAPTDLADAEAVRVKPSVLAGFVRSLPTVLSADRVSAVASALRESLAHPVGRHLWTVNKVLEWTRDAHGDELAGNRASRRRGGNGMAEPIVGFLLRHAALIAVAAVLLTLAAILGP